MVAEPNLPSNRNATLPLHPEEHEELRKKRQKEHEAAQKKFLEQQSRRIKRQQMKIIELMNIHKHGIGGLKKSSDDTVQTKMFNHLMTRDEMKAHHVSVDVGCHLLSEPKPWQYDNQVDASSTNIRHLSGVFGGFVDHEEKSVQ